MSSFEELRNDYYHRVAIAPDEPYPTRLFYSDIVLHLPVLEYYASLCEHVTEFGVREGCSTTALIAGCKGVVNSYDIETSPVVSLLSRTRLPCARWEFRQQNTVAPGFIIPPTDFLFIDTLHTFDHVRQELAIHGRQAGKYLGFHDTYTCGELDKSGPDQNAPGILPAIYTFLAQYLNEYKTVYRTNVNNGLWILSRESV